LYGCLRVLGICQVPKRIIAYHIARLVDKSPTTRLEAIRELELLAAPEALEALQSVFENDSDKDVRKAAQDAGRAIYRKLQENPR